MKMTIAVLIILALAFLNGVIQLFFGFSGWAYALFLLYSVVGGYFVASIVFPWAWAEKD